MTRLYPTCENCTHWRRGEVDHPKIGVVSTQDGLCRRMPPMSFVVTRSLDGQLSSKIETHWPTTHESDSCGEGRFKEEDS